MEGSVPYDKNVENKKGRKIQRMCGGKKNGSDRNNCCYVFPILSVFVLRRAQHKSAALSRCREARWLAFCASPVY